MSKPRSQVFIGVDGGASKTRVVALGVHGDMLGEACGPPATLNGGADTAWATILDTIGNIALLSDADLSQASMVVGIAGTEIESAFRAFAEAAPECGALEIVSDAHIACAGAHDLADGAIVAVGTGVIGFCREGGKTARAGGWGFPHDDRGSGAWLGLEAVACALCTSDGRRADNKLADGVLRDFDDADALAAWACTARSTDFARYARLVVELAAAGEQEADNLLGEAGRHVSTVARALVGERPGLRLALTGGLADTMGPRLDDDLRDRLTAPVYDSAQGAALMARQVFNSLETF